jgi:hypothetical protein
MKRVGIEINGVLRDTIGKFKQLYEKNLIEGYQSEFTHQTYLMKSDGEPELEETPIPFKYKQLSPVTSLNLREHFAFQSEDEFYSFSYEEFAMELFGHAQSAEYSTFHDLNDIYTNLRDEFNFLIVSDEMGKSKPASLFFLSKFGCLLEKIKFYSNITIDSMWDEIDILVTSNPNLIEECPSDKIVIKYETDYNKDVNSKHTITTIKELENKIKKLNTNDV